MEVTRAYWQSHQDIFKGFFFAKDANNKDSQKIENMMQSVSEKSGFPIEIYSPKKEQEIGTTYNGKTPVSLLYRFITPIKHNLTLKNNYNLIEKDNGWFIVNDKIECVCDGNIEDLKTRNMNVERNF